MELEKSKKKNFNEIRNQDGPEFSELKKVIKNNERQKKF